MFVLKKNSFKDNIMLKEFSEVELDITKEIINIGLSKAADSLSFFTKEKVLIKLFDLQVNSETFTSFSLDNKKSKSYLLTTIIRGDINGKAYLIFNESEVEKIIDVNLPDTIKNNPREKANMTDAVLLEIDNIITASVITQFANILQCKLYGDVPQLTILPENGINQFLNQENSYDLNVIYFNSRFITSSSSINSEFIWLMEDKFLRNVKNIVSDEKKLELLRQLNVH